MPASLADRLDPFTVGLAANRLVSILEEQQATLIRTAFSTIVRESEDLACGVFDSAGQMVAQSRSGTPGHINAMATGVRHFAQAFPRGALQPGDVLLTNDPWMTAGQVNDITVVTPVFVADRLAGFFASTCHAPDIGGRILSGEATEVYEEGLRLPIMHLAKAGTYDQTLIAIIRENVRTPDETVGDLYAQAAANDVGARRLLALLDELGLDDIDRLGEEICARSERAMRRVIGALPNGIYEHEVMSDGFTQPVRLHVCATVEGDTIDLDFTGSAPESEHGINLVLNYTRAYASFAMKAALAPEVPHNAGSFRPVTVRAPLGSILNCRPPAPVASRHLIGHLLPGLILGALEPALDTRVIASGADSVWITVWRGEREDQTPFNITLFQSGGMGARHGKDGLNATGFPAAVAAVPTEILETMTPLLQRERTLLRDSGGAGRNRGGLGQRSRITCDTGAPWSVSVLAERTAFAAPGLAGGSAGALGAVSSDGVAFAPKRLRRMAADAEVQLDLPGGGGLGPATERDPQAVLADVVDGYVSIEAAARSYGVTVRYTGRPDALVRTVADYELVKDPGSPPASTTGAA
jgi:N-methylhydantoinase B